MICFLSAGACSLRLDSATFDETAHLPAGYSYLDRGDFRMNPEHPPLLKVWAALPLKIVGVEAPDYETPAWRGRAEEEGRSRTGADQWTFGYSWMNGPIGDTLRREPQRKLVPARLAMLLGAVPLALLCWAWSRESLGPAAGLLALFLFAFSPTMLAHSRLVTTDLPNALGFTATLWSFWRFTRRPGWGRASVLAIVLALALLIKFSALLLLPFLVSLGLLWIAWPGIETDRRQRALELARAVALCAIAVPLATWAAYGFRFAAATDPAYALDWGVIGPVPGLADRAIQLALDWRLVPEAYGYGLAYFLGGAWRRLGYLNGTQALVGWWYYFPEAFLLKTPPATLLLLIVAGCSAFRRRAWKSFDTWIGTLPVLVYLAISMGGRLNIGHRHLTPIYPLLFLGVASLAPLASKVDGKLVRPILLLALPAYLVSFAFATPGYLSYFNSFAGGPAGAPRFLLDSNLDWGQDLRRLSRWMERERVPEVYLAYFGTADPAAFGIRYRKVALVHDFAPQREAVRPSSGDWLAVSVNLLHGLYLDSERDLAWAVVRPGWVQGEEIQRWLHLRDDLSAAGQRHPGLGDWLVERGLLSEDQLASARDNLLITLFARIRERPPDARPGDSIWVYRVP